VTHKSTARVISTILSTTPVTAAVVVILAVANPFGPQAKLAVWQTIAIGLAMLSIAPIGAVLYFHWKQHLDVDVSDRKKRPIFFVPALIAYFASAAVFASVEHRTMYLISVAYFLVGLAHLGVTMIWKISLHVAGLASPITALVFTYGIWLIPLYALVVLLIWARMKLGAHTLSQAVAGALMSGFVTFVVYRLLS